MQITNIEYNPKIGKINAIINIKNQSESIELFNFSDYIDTLIGDTIQKYNKEKQEEEYQEAVNLLKQYKIYDKNIHEQICYLLDNNEEVFSRAFGRIGKIIRATDYSVYIKFTRETGITTFLSGDKVYLTKNKGKWIILNTLEELEEWSE